MMASPFIRSGDTPTVELNTSLQRISIESTIQMAHIKSRPKLKDLLEELRSITTSWKSLMINLGVKKYDLDRIETESNGKIIPSKQDSFDLWLRRTPNASWKDIIDALFTMEENVLAGELSKKYRWIDPRVSVRLCYASAPRGTPITAKLIPKDLPCRKAPPPLQDGQQYYTLETPPLQPINRSVMGRITKIYTRLITEKQKEGYYNLFQYLQSIEKSDSKCDFKVGLEARFGKAYWKMHPGSILPAKSSYEEWRQSRLLRKTAFNTDVNEGDIEQLFRGRQQLGKTCTSITLKFSVEGLDEGNYSALIAVHENDQFYLDAVYRETARENKARIDIALAGRKYDFRISDCSECILLEHVNSTPFKIAARIVNSLRRLPDRKLRLILCGTTAKEESLWRVKYIRQRVQEQYKWKPKKKWILARYDIDVFDQGSPETMKVESAKLIQNTPFDIPEFNYSRKEVELWGQQIFPKDVNDTHPSTDKYYYMEGIHGVTLSGGESRKPYNWTAEYLMRDFEEFLGDAFKIAHILGGSLY